MKNSIVSFVVGIIFAIGLGVSGMTQPPKIAGFLNIFGLWDPSLLFVMIGAIGVHIIAYPLIRKRRLPVFVNEWQVPKNTKLTKSLVLGAFIFGIGWGLSGYCPGPGIVSLASLGSRPVLFVLSMLFGMFIFKKIMSWRSSKI